MNCLNFDMNECNFSEKIMNIKDRNGLSREGSSRVALHKATGITHCYTLECNYHNGKRINTLAPKFIKHLNMLEEETPVTDPGSKIYANTNSPPFTVEIFEDVGHATAVALLDHINSNPISRIHLSCFRTVQNVRDDIMNNLQKYSAGQVNVCGVNHFSNTNSKVGKQYGKADTKVEKLAYLKRDPAKPRAQSKDSANLKGLQKKGSGNLGIAQKKFSSTDGKKLQRKDNPQPKSKTHVLTEPLEQLIAQAARHGLALEEILKNLNIQLYDQKNGEMTATLTQA